MNPEQQARVDVLIDTLGRIASPGEPSWHAQCTELALIDPFWDVRVSETLTHRKDGAFTWWWSDTIPQRLVHLHNEGELADQHFLRAPSEVPTHATCVVALRTWGRVSLVLSMATLEELRPWLADQVRHALDVYKPPHPIFQRVLKLVLTTSLNEWPSQDLEELRRMLDQARRSLLGTGWVSALDPWRCLHNTPAQLEELRTDQLFEATHALLSQSHYVASWGVVRGLSMAHTLEAVRQGRVSQCIEQLQLCEMFYEELCARLQEHLFGNIWG